MPCITKKVKLKLLKIKSVINGTQGQKNDFGNSQKRVKTIGNAQTSNLS